MAGGGWVVAWEREAGGMGVGEKEGAVAAEKGAGACRPERGDKHGMSSMHDATVRRVPSWAAA